jgi:hypothetical protein
MTGTTVGRGQPGITSPSLVPLRSRQGAALIAATVLASLIGFLDASVVNVAVPASPQ